MSPEEIAVLLRVHSDAFKDCIDLFVKEQNRKFDKHEQLITELQKKCSSLERSLEYTQSQLDEAKGKLSAFEGEKRNAVSTEVKKLKESIQDLDNRTTESFKAVHGRCDYLEDASRRQNLRVIGVPDSAGETWEQSAEHVKTLLKERCDLPDVSLERAHRVGAYDPARTRPIVARFSRFQDREAALRNSRKIRNAKFKFKEDLCEASRKKRADQWPAMQEAFKKGLTAYFNHTTREG